MSVKYLGQLLAEGKVAISSSSNELSAASCGVQAIGDLSAYQQLRSLNVSFNPLPSLAGIDVLPHLRSLSAYCCLLPDLEAISACGKLEVLNVQQNGITDIGFAFMKLRSLKSCRMDRNRLERLSGLQECQYLRFLDVSFNGVSSLEGVRGLQSLEELRANNNRLASLSSLRALPSLHTLEVARNQLTCLDGISEVGPSLRVLNVEGNAIGTLTLSAPSNFKGKLKTAVSKGSIPASATDSASDLRSRPKEDRSVVRLSELFLRGNKLQSLVGLDTLGDDSLEVLDLRENFLDDVSALTTALQTLTTVIELHLSGNPFEVQGPSLLTADVLAACPTLIYLDGVKVSEAVTEEGGEAAVAYEAVETEEHTTGGDLAADRALLEVVSAEHVRDAERVFRSLLRESRARLTAMPQPQEDSSRLDSVFQTALIEVLDSKASESSGAEKEKEAAGVS